MTRYEIQKEIQRIAKSGGYISPGPADVHVNRPLTNISIAYMQSDDMFIADKVFPDVPVLKQSDVYFTIPRGAFNRDDMQERAPGTESAGADYEVDTEDYRAKVWALHKNIDDQTRANYDSPLAPDRTATRFLSGKGLIRKEKLFVDNYMKDGVWAFGVDGHASNRSITDFLSASNNSVVQWSVATSTPIEDIRLFKRVMQAYTGYRPNVLVLGPTVYDTLLDHPDIVARLDRGQTTGTAMANKEAIAALFEIDEILVMEGIYNAAKQGLTDVHQFFNSKDALLVYRPDSPGLEVPSAGYTFSWTGFIGAGNMGTRMKRMRMEHLESDRVEIQMAFVQKVVATDLGFWIDAIVA